MRDIDQKQLTPKRIEPTYQPKAHVDSVSNLSQVEPTYQSRYSHKTTYQHTHGGDRVNYHRGGETYNKYDEFARGRDDHSNELQPQVVQASKHWYDEFPIEDRRKQLQQSIQRRKEKEFQFFNQHNNQKVENHRDRSCDNVESRLGFHRNSQFDQNDIRDLSDKKYFSRSYNRSGYVSKRTFAQPLKGQESAELNVGPSTPMDLRNYGNSMSHGLGRNFRSHAETTFRQLSHTEQNINKCGIKFNTKSVNYDMSEIELPAYCKTHPEGKLLYIITPHSGQESELGCVYCALDLNQEKDKYTIIEVKQKLDEYINHTSELLKSKPRSSNNEDVIMKIGICKDREIAMIRQYYDKMMEALALERDRHISQITAISEENIDTAYQSHSQHKTSEHSKADIKLKNFGNELGKVLDGVEETGIHIKELWKINQDYNDIVKQKMNEVQSVPGQTSSDFKSFEFHIADENRLKDLAKKVGQVVTRPVGLDYFIYDEYDNSNRRAPTTTYTSSYSQGYNQDINKIEYVPTFGITHNNEDLRRYGSEFQSTENIEGKYQYSSKYEKGKYSRYEPTKYEGYDPSTYSYSQNAIAPDTEGQVQTHPQYNYTGNGFSPEYKTGNSHASRVTPEYGKGQNYLSHISSEERKSQLYPTAEGRYNVQSDPADNNDSRIPGYKGTHSYTNTRSFGDRNGYTYTGSRGQEERTDNRYMHARTSEERYSRSYVTSSKESKTHYTYNKVSNLVIILNFIGKFE